MRWCQDVVEKKGAVTVVTVVTVPWKDTHSLTIPSSRPRDGESLSSLLSKELSLLSLSRASRFQSGGYSSDSPSDSPSRKCHRVTSNGQVGAASESVGHVHMEVEDREDSRSGRTVVPTGGSHES